MSDQLYMFYQEWVETEEYHNQSAVENNLKNKCLAKVEKEVGNEEIFARIEDDIVGLAANAEQSGFERGFKAAAIFMTEILKGDIKA